MKDLEVPYGEVEDFEEDEKYINIKYKKNEFLIKFTEHEIFDKTILVEKKTNIKQKENNVKVYFNTKEEALNYINNDLFEYEKTYNYLIAWENHMLLFNKNTGGIVGSITYSICKI